MATLPRATTTTKPLARALLAVLVTGAVALLIVRAGKDQTLSIDGGLYMDVASHVRDGDGLVSDVSLYHAGALTFPAPTPVYPMWPLLLGTVAKVVPLDVAARALPIFLYALGLALWAHVGQRLAPRLGTGRVRRFGLHGGHVVVVVLGLAEAYARFSCRPYTEPLAFALAAIGVLVGRAALQRPSFARGLAAGAVCGLVWLTRSQLLTLGAALGAAGALLLVLRRDRAAAAFVVGAALGVSALVSVQWARLSRAFPDLPPSALVEVEKARFTDALSRFQPLVEDQGALAALADRATGLAVAFSPTRAQSLVASFHAHTYALPSALVLLAALALSRRRRRVLAVLTRASLRPPQAFFLVFAALAAVTLLWVHKDYGTEWPFARRHGVAAVFAISVSYALLLRAPWRLVRGAALVLLVVGALHGVNNPLIIRRTRDWGEVGRDQLAKRIVELRDAHAGPLTIAVANNEAQQLAGRIDGVGIHWIHSATTAADLDALVKTLGVDVVVAPTADRRGKRSGTPDGFDALPGRREELPRFTLVFVDR